MTGELAGRFDRAAFGYSDFKAGRVAKCGGGNWARTEQPQMIGRDGEWLIGFGELAGDATLSVDGDLVEAAARLFDLLHEADATRARSIAVAPIPETGLGLAINDRLRRAAAPR